MAAGRSHPTSEVRGDLREEPPCVQMGKTRDLIKKIRDTKGTFHAKKGSIKDMTEAT